MSDSQLQSDRPTLFLLDGYALIYRAFFAMISRPLTTSSGENTSAPFGMARFLMRLIADHEPDYLGVVFDAGHSFRADILPEYKATREKMPDELRASLPRCREVFEAFRVPIVEAEGWEADDVIGTLSRLAAEAGLQTVVVSGDKDFHQLVDGDTALLNPGRGGPAGVEQHWVTSDNASERLGVPPERVTDYLALVGDSSDNVPGVPNVGPGWAKKLISLYGDLEQVLAHAEEAKNSRVRESLEAHADDARLSKRLVTIQRDAPVTLDLPALERQPPDADRVREVFVALEFHALLQELEISERAAAAPEAEYETVGEVHAVGAAVAALTDRATATTDSVPGLAPLGVLALGDDPDPLRARLVGLALSGESGRGYYFPFGHRPPEIIRDADGNPTLALESPADSAASDPGLPGISTVDLAPLADLLESDRPKVGHDLKYTLQILHTHGIELGGLEFDTAIGSYGLDPGRRERGLPALVLDRFAVALPIEADLTGTGRAATPLAELPPDEVRDLAAGYADYARRLAVIQAEELESHGMASLIGEIEMPLLPVLARMERVGIAIDLDFFAALRTRLRNEIELVQAEITKIAGGEVNLRSVPQLRELLFDTLGLPVLKKTKTGPSTDETVLEQLAADGHRIPRLILEHRELDKLDGTYVSKLPALADAEGRIHTQFNQAIATTGRLTSSDPNLQNIPIRRELGREIRKGFVPASGFLLVGADYSQVELRVMAHLSGDPAFVEAFRADRDIHRETAARIFGVEPERVTGAMREQAKTINFATIYGQGPVALARQLGISRIEATRFIDAYFERFSGVASYLEDMKEVAREHGYVETLLGRRRYIPEIRSRNPGIRGFGERTATNSPIQGTAADLIKIAMIRLDRRLADTDSRMLLQVHDELLFEVPEGDVDEIGPLVRGEMESALELDVPLKVDLGVGETWYDTKFSA